MARPDLEERFRRSKLERYLLAEERVVIAQHQHWAVLAQPIGAVVGGLIVVVAIDTWLPGTLGGLTNLFWWAWLALLGWGLLQILLWSQRWLVATNKRLLMNYGLIIKEGVAMLSLSRVVDLTYIRTTPGKLFGYGTLVRESAGHNQTLHEVRWVRKPDETYRTICATVFDLEDRARGVERDRYSHRFGDAQPPHAPGLHTPYVPLEERTRGTDVPAERARTDDPPGIQIRYGETKRVARQPYYLSPDLRDSSLREADTGAIHYRRPATDESDDWIPTPDAGDGDDGSDSGDDDLGD